MKESLEKLVREALDAIRKSTNLEVDQDVAFKIEKTRNPSHGDFASNIAMVIAKQTPYKPRDLAEKIVSNLPASPLVSKVEIAGPGFINFFLKHDSFLDIIRIVKEKGDQYGRSDRGKGQTVLIEFVSANPTGPLHIGHGRGAAYGAATGNLLEAAGFKVSREYYLNDAGRQIDILAASIWLRYLQLSGREIVLPANAYQGDYIREIAARILEEKGTTLACEPDELTEHIGAYSDDEKQIDNLITAAKTLLGETDYRTILETGLDAIRNDIEQDLEQFGVVFDNWFSEQGLIDSSKVDDAMDILRKNGFLYEKDGATWFQSRRLGDEKDRVVIRENGQLTYFATDIAYHLSKYERGFSKMIDIWGADHHGYIARIKASLKALGKDPAKLDVLLVQFATLYRGEEKLQMSTRSGQFVSLRELRNEVGNDAARFFYVMRKSEQHLDFDLELAKSESQDNPVYYIQYAHARISSVMRQARENNINLPGESHPTDLGTLQESHEKSLLKRLASYPEIVEVAALQYEPHQLVFYLRELANVFHTYYNACQILVPDKRVRDARLELILAVQQVIKNGLSLLGVSAPERM